MLTMRHHNSHDYAMLPDIDAADAGKITNDDQACLGEIGDCLLRTGAHSRFGATLLHSHFPTDDDEILLEEVQTEANSISLRPVRAKPWGLSATNVCFDDADARGGGLRLVGLEFALNRALAGVAPIGEFDGNVLTSLAEILRRYGKTRRFGIRLLHDPLNLDGGVLLETCDPIRRILTCRSSTQDDLASVQSIPTVFCWEEVRERSQGNLFVGQECIQFCKSVQRCVVSAQGSHRNSSSHEPTGHRSV